MFGRPFGWTVMNSSARLSERVHPWGEPGQVPRPPVLPGFRRAHTKTPANGPAKREIRRPAPAWAGSVQRTGLPRQTLGRWMPAHFETPMSCTNTRMIPDGYERAAESVVQKPWTPKYLLRLAVLLQRFSPDININAYGASTIEHCVMFYLPSVRFPTASATRNCLTFRVHCTQIF